MESFTFLQQGTLDSVHPRNMLHSKFLQYPLLSSDAVGLHKIPSSLPQATSKWSIFKMRHLQQVVAAKHAFRKFNLGPTMPRKYNKNRKNKLRYS